MDVKIVEKTKLTDHVYNIYIPRSHFFDVEKGIEKWIKESKLTKNIFVLKTKSTTVAPPEDILELATRKLAQKFNVKRKKLELSGKGRLKLKEVEEKKFFQKTYYLMIPKTHFSEVSKEIKKWLKNKKELPKINLKKIEQSTEKSKQAVLEMVKREIAEKFQEEMGKWFEAQKDRDKEEAANKKAKEKLKKMDLKEKQNLLYNLRVERAIHPNGYFEDNGSWYPEEKEEMCKCCYSVRHPSRAYPYSLMLHCRTLKHIKNLEEKFIDQALIKKFKMDFM